jgi:hypothetical protein
MHALRIIFFLISVFFHSATHSADAEPSAQAQTAAPAESPLMRPRSRLEQPEASATSCNFHGRVLEDGSKIQYCAKSYADGSGCYSSLCMSCSNGRLSDPYSC